jgi:hypothetical protein
LLWHRSRWSRCSCIFSPFNSCARAATSPQKIKGPIGRQRAQAATD